jgi:hypothetical protein
METEGRVRRRRRGWGRERKGKEGKEIDAAKEGHAPNFPFAPSPRLDGVHTM